MGTVQGKQQWHASYWNEETHGSAWGRAREALKRDWAQTKADFNVDSGKELNQQVGDTVKQAAGKEPIPPGATPNAPDFDKMEPAVSYGFGAHEQYGQKYSEWDDQLEARLEREWDPSGTGIQFSEAKPYVRRGWDFRK